MLYYHLGFPRKSEVSDNLILVMGYDALPLAIINPMNILTLEILTRAPTLALTTSPLN